MMGNHFPSATFQSECKDAACQLYSKVPNCSKCRAIDTGTFTQQLTCQNEAFHIGAIFGELFFLYLGEKAL